MSEEDQAKESARLIIPAWGDVYVSKLLSITLPALLASGNLPALCNDFHVELVIVTESRVFERIRQSRIYGAAEKICPVRLVPLDDLMTDRSVDYGMMLTYALFRGFTDLGTSMTETYLLFLNTDFILCDGSLRHLAKLMRDGARVIHAPSFRVVLEDVWAHMQARVDASSCALSMPAREMVRLALANRHRTVQARTVNQRLCYQTYQDQFYWYVDDETLIGYQWPVALVAIKPERLVAEPVMFWDFGFIPEAAPTARPYYIGDSDEFFMLELQARNSGQDMIRVGSATVDEIAATLALYATKEHLESGRQVLTIHAGELPAGLDAVIDESRAYMAEVVGRLPPNLVSHVNHPRLGQWFEETKRRRQAVAAAPAPHGSASDFAPQPARRFAASVLFSLQDIHRNLFGALPEVGPSHPLWAEVWPVTQAISKWRIQKKQILWISSVESQWGALLGPRISPSALSVPALGHSLAKEAYDACLCEIGLSELFRLRHLYGRIRPLLRDGGEILVMVTPGKGILNSAGAVLGQAEYPLTDISEMTFYGNAITSILRKITLPALRPIPTRTFVRAAIVVALILSSPLIWLVNCLGVRRPTRRVSRFWSAVLIRFVVRRRNPAPRV